MRRFVAAAITVLVLFASPAFAVTPDEMLKDPQLEGRARALSAGFRCMVCQNQSIDDSDAPLAHDIRVLLRERIVAGDSDKAVTDFLVSRYGEFILLQPRFSVRTAILWGAPIGVLVIGAGVILVVLRRRHHIGVTEPLSEDERARLKSIVGGEPRRS